jgi:hypothetical protein
MRLWRPIFIIAVYVIVLWREFYCVKIPQSEANKSANRWGNLRAKGVYLALLVCESNTFILHDFAAYFYSSHDKILTLQKDAGKAVKAKKLLVKIAAFAQ